MSHKYINQWSHLDKNRFSRKTHIHHLFRCACISWIEDILLWCYSKPIFEEQEEWVLRLETLETIYQSGVKTKGQKYNYVLDFFGYEPSNQEQSAAAANNWFLLKCKHLSCPFRQNAQMECISSFVILTNTIFVQYNTEKILLFGRK